MPNRLSGAAQHSGALRGRSGALGRSKGPQGQCSAQQAPSSSAGAQGLCCALGALRPSAGAQGPCGKQGVLRRPGAIQRSRALGTSRHLGLCSTLGVLRNSAGAQQAPKGLAALKGRSDTHKALRGCAALSRSTAAGTQQAVPRSGGAQQRAPSWRCSAQQALRCPAGTQELLSAQGALSGAEEASRWLSAQGALSEPQGRSRVAQGRSGAHQALRGCAVLSRRSATGA